MVHSNFDHGETVKKVGQLFRFGLDIVLAFFGDVPMTASNFNLHGRSLGS